MKKGMIAIRGIDEKVYRKFKAKTAEEKMKMGSAVTEAMRRWLKEKTIAEPDPRNLLKISGIIKTKKKVRWSEEIDEILYGWKK